MKVLHTIIRVCGAKRSKNIDKRVSAFNRCVISVGDGYLSPLCESGVTIVSLYFGATAHDLVHIRRRPMENRWTAKEEHTAPLGLELFVGTFLQTFRS